MRTRSQSYLLHLRIGLNECSQDLRVGHQALRQRRVQDLPDHLRVAHNLPLQPLLHLHEVGRPHTQAGHAGQAAHCVKAEGSLTGVRLPGRTLRLLLLVSRGRLLIVVAGRTAFDDEVHGHAVLDTVLCQCFRVLQDFAREDEAQLLDGRRKLRGYSFLDLKEPK